MYGGMLPNTGGFLLNPLRVLYLIIALYMFVGAWAVRKVFGEKDAQSERAGRQT